MSGELLDLTNGSGTDLAAVRWMMGEVPSRGLFLSPGGEVHNMKNPPAFGGPDRVRSLNDTADLRERTVAGSTLTAA